MMHLDAPCVLYSLSGFFPQSNNQNIFYVLCHQNNRPVWLVQMFRLNMVQAHKGLARGGGSLHGSLSCCRINWR